MTRKILRPIRPTVVLTLNVGTHQRPGTLPTIRLDPLVVPPAAFRGNTGVRVFNPHTFPTTRPPRGRVGRLIDRSGVQAGPTRGHRRPEDPVLCHGPPAEGLQHRRGLHEREPRLAERRLRGTVVDKVKVSDSVYIQWQPLISGTRLRNNVP